MNLIAEKEQLITVYSFDASNQSYICNFEYLWAVDTGLPANSTNIKPPVFKSDEVPVFSEQSQIWSVVEDHRGKTVYSTTDQSKSIIDYISKIKDGFTLFEPTSSFETWTDNAWLDQRTSDEKAFHIRQQLPKLSKRQFSLYLYDNDLYDQVISAINANPRFKIEFDTVSDIERLSPAVASMCQLLGWTDEQVDQMWGEVLNL